MATKKKPSPAQLAARAKFVAMVRAKSKAKKSATKKATVKKAAPKKAAKKKVATKKALTHKDTKSHNVRISVVSGISEKSIHTLNYLVKELKSAEQNYDVLKNRKKTDKYWNTSGFNDMYKRYPLYIRSLKKQITETKKHIK
tara:strand:- start:2597 stop:3022 length:426 start_codon:yes stop_codon:yes gene_type:complete